MRPLELRLRNFRSYYGDEAVFSFRGRSLVGIVGPIGSGKSSILDAIAFALYGKTPAVASATRGLIHQRAAEATVALRFEVDGEVWEAVRMLRVKGQSQHALYRLDADDPGVEPVEKITMEADVNAKVAELLGLEFDAFGRSVLLAQGRFAEFLRARPAERDKVLKGVFGHDRIDTMREVAKTKAGAVVVELEKLAIRVEHLDMLEQRLVAHREELAASTAALERLEEAAPTLQGIVKRITDASSAEADATRRLDELGALAARMPDPDTTARLFEEAAGVAARRTGLATDLDAAQAALAEADAAVAKAEADGIPRTIDEAGGRLAAAVPLERATAEAVDRVDGLVEHRAAHEQRVVEATGRVASTADAVAAASQEADARAAVVATAEASLLTAQHADMASTLRRDLHDGDACPVCLQEVATVPESVRPTDVTAAEETLADARAALGRAEAARTAAVGAAQGAREALAALTAEGKRLADEHAAAVTAAEAARAEHEEMQRALRGLLGDGDPASLLSRLRESHQASLAAAADARKRVERVRADHEAAIRDQQELGKRLAALHVDIAGLAAKLDVGLEIADDTPAALQAGLDQLRSEWSRVSGDLSKARVAAGEELTEASKARTELLSSLGVDGEFAAVLAAARAGVAVAAKAIADGEKELARAGELRAQYGDLAATQGRFEQIASDLTDSRFVRFLLDGERTRLAALGSEHFERLTSGRYRFTEDGKFQIVDLTAADAVRKADSLSGGETFLASLALALALAEMVARTGGRLDAFFLDEGFGSLDPEHLDLAMEGIEALVADASERLVVVVSHVPELRSRLEDLIVLDRNPVTGDTKVLSA